MLTAYPFPATGDCVQEQAAELSECLKQAFEAVFAKATLEIAVGRTA